MAQDTAFYNKGGKIIKVAQDLRCSCHRTWLTAQEQWKKSSRQAGTYPKYHSPYCTDKLYTQVVSSVCIYVKKNY
jgi:hypothetical protein